MLKGIQAAHELNKEGRLHKKLVFRFFLLGGISVVSLGIVIANIFLRGLNPGVTLVLALAGFVFGFWIFYRMNPIKWNEEKEFLIVTRVDAVGFIILAIYIALRLAVKYYLEHLYHDVIILTGFTLAIVFGVSFGKLIASLLAVKKAHAENINN